MAWTAITDRDICVQGQENKIDCIASGTIYAGQGVTLTEGSVASAGSSEYQRIYVAAGNTGVDKKALGIAAIGATNGNRISVYTAGAMCWTRANSSVSQGDWLYVAADGDWDDCTDAAAAEIAMSGAAIALIPQASTDGMVLVQLK
jgi:hypothetical protein